MVEGTKERTPGSAPEGQNRSTNRAPGASCILEGVSRGKRVHAALAAVVVASGPVALVACGSDDAAPPGCLSDQQICQFKKGVSTKADVQKALGNPNFSIGAGTSTSASMSNTWDYLCLVVSGPVSRNEQTVFDFDDSGVLTDVTVLRLGSASAPAPDCEAGGAGGVGGVGGATM